MALPGHPCYGLCLLTVGWRGAVGLILATDEFNNTPFASFVLHSRVVCSLQ